MKMANKPVLYFSRKEAEVLTDFYHFLDEVFPVLPIETETNIEDILGAIAWAFYERPGTVNNDFTVEITDDKD